MVLCGCSGSRAFVPLGSQSQSTLSLTNPQTPPAQPASSQQGAAEFLIHIPYSSNSNSQQNSSGISGSKKLLYISSSTQSMTISVNSGNPTTVNLTPSSSNCSTSNSTLTCTATVQAPVGNDTFDVATYDQPNGSGNLLSTATVPLTIVSGETETAPITLNGIIASFKLTLSNLTPTIGQSSTITLYVNALDADGNTIVGPGNYNNPISLTSSDSTDAALSTSSITSPSTSSVTINYKGADVSSITFTASATGATSKTITMTPISSTTALLTDNFTQDSNLNSSLWSVITNSSAPGDYIADFDCPPGSIISPTLSFSSSGMEMTGVSGSYEQGGVQSVHSFSPPFTATAQVEASQIGSGAIQFDIINSSGSSGINFAVAQGGSSQFTGIFFMAPGGGSCAQTWDQDGTLSSSYQLNTLYTLTISVNSSGTASLTAAAGGSTIGQAAWNVGTSSFNVILSQGTGANSGSNQTYWHSVQVTSP